MRLIISIVVLSPALANAELIGYAGGASPAGLYRVQPQTGTTTFVTSVQSFLSSGGLTSFNGDFYATNYTPQVGVVPPNTYVRLNVTTGQITAVGQQTSSNWYGLTTNQVAGILYVADADTSTVLKFTPGGSIVSIGSTGLPISDSIRGMAYDSQTGTLYGTDYYDNTAGLYRINTTTGLAMLVGSLGLPPVVGGGDIPIAFDDTHTLYAATGAGTSLYSVNLQNGAATLIANLGMSMSSLTVVPEPSTSLLMAAIVTVAGLRKCRMRRNSCAKARNF
jgi:hypothetical protein